MTQLVKRVDELNVTQLGLISAQDQVQDQREWSYQFVRGTREYRVSCAALPEYGIPHGIDNDVSAAIIDSFIAQGMPTDGQLQMSVTQLLRLCGFHKSGKYYQMLRVSLERLATTTYTISGGWRDHTNGRWTHAKFTYIQNLTWSARDSGQFDERTILSFSLAPAIVTSLHGGYTKPLDTEFMLSLSRPRTRILYRLLDSMRFDPEDLDTTRDVFETGISDLADICKLSQSHLSNVRRSLQAPHDELIKKGFLRSVTYSGRGQHQRIRYEFHENLRTIDPTLFNRLRRYGVATGVIHTLATTYSKAVLLQRIDQFARMLKDGSITIKKSEAAALVHLIKNADQYPDVEKVPVLPKVKAPPKPSEPEPANYQSDFEGLEPVAAAELFVRRLTLYFGKKFDVTTLDALKQGVTLGELSPPDVLREGSLALARMQAQDFVLTLRQAAQRWV